MIKRAARAWITKKENKDGSASYVVGIKVDGLTSPHRKRWPTLALAQEYASETEVQVNKGEFFKKQREQKESGLTFKDAANLYIADCEFRGLTPKVIKNKRSVLERVINPILGKFPLEEITPGMIKDIQKERKAAEMSKQTIVLDTHNITGVFNFMIAEGKYSGASPMLRVKSINPDNKTTRAFSKEEITKIADAIKSPDLFQETDMHSKTLQDKWRKELLDLFLFAIFTGCRLGEILALKWRDINLAEGTISIGLNTHVVARKKTKKSRRIVPLMAAASKFIMGISKTAGSDLIFQTSHRKLWLRALELAQLDEPAVFHTTRHTFATNFIQAGGAIEKLQEILGHADVSTTRQRYAHVDTQMLLKEIKVMDNFWGSEPAALGWNTYRTHEQKSSLEQKSKIAVNNDNKKAYTSMLA